MQCNWGGLLILIDSKVSTWLFVIPLKYRGSSFRIMISESIFRDYVESPVSIIKLISRDKPIVTIVTVGACEKSLGFKTVIRTSLG